MMYNESMLLKSVFMLTIEGKFFSDKILLISYKIKMSEHDPGDYFYPRRYLTSLTYPEWEKPRNLVSGGLWARIYPHVRSAVGPSHTHIVRDL